MKIIDMHTHVYPDLIAARAARNIRDYYQLGDNMDGTIATLLERGRAAGVSQYLILPVSVKPEHARTINQFTVHQTGEHSCFIGFGTLHPGMEKLMDEVDWIPANGLKGIKIHPDCQHFDIDDPRMFPVYEAIQGRLPMMIHTGDANSNHSHPARLRRVLDLFPNLQVCAAHLGGHTMYDTAKEYLSATNCILDLSSTLMFLDKKAAQDYINHYGAERLAYGTDYPVWDPVQEIERFLSLDLTAQQQEQILSKTAERFLNL